MEILRIEAEEQLQIKQCVIMHLILLKIQNMMDIKKILFLVYNFFDKKFAKGSSIKN